MDSCLIFRFSFLGSYSLLARSQLQTLFALIFVVTQKELDNKQYLQYTKIIEAFDLLRC